MRLPLVMARKMARAFRLVMVAFLSGEVVGWHVCDEVSVVCGYGHVSHDGFSGVVVADELTYLVQEVIPFVSDTHELSVAGVDSGNHGFKGAAFLTGGDECCHCVVEVATVYGVR